MVVFSIAQFKIVFILKIKHLMPLSTIQFIDGLSIY